VKRQTLILVLIGVVLFVAGGGIAFATVEAGNKTHDATGPTVAATNTPVVVATRTIPAGTTGQTMVAQGLVSIRDISQKQYSDVDITSVQSLNDEVLTRTLTKGAAVTATDLSASTTSLSLPKGLQGITIQTTGVAGLAGYLQPGSDIDIYANVTRVSSASTLAIPCTELVMSSVEVLDVSSIVAPLGNHQNSLTGGRSAPSSMTLLLAVTPMQARVLTFMSLNETLSVTQTQKGVVDPQVGQCIGTAQTAVAP